jgi:hypothetical protein
MTADDLVPDTLWKAIQPLLPTPPPRYGGRPRGPVARAGGPPSSTATRVAPVSSGAASVLMVVVLGLLGAVEQVIDAPC